MKEQLVKRTIYSFFGPPGSGKGTLAQKLVADDCYLVLSTGNLCRQHVAMGSEFGKMLNQYLKQGHLIPDALVTEMVIDWLLGQRDTIAPIILDGFPRTQGQAEIFLDFLRRESDKFLLKIIAFDLSDDEIVKRLSQRVVCSNKGCQATFTDSQQLQSCAFCGGILIKREDDQEHVVRERLMQFPAHKDALLGFYRTIGQAVEHLDIAGLIPFQVYERFCSLVENCDGQK
jgi:adenylate kinase